MPSWIDPTSPACASAVGEPWSSRLRCSRSLSPLSVAETIPKADLRYRNAPTAGGEMVVVPEICVGHTTSSTSSTQHQHHQHQHHRQQRQWRQLQIRWGCRRLVVVPHWLRQQTKTPSIYNYVWLGVRTADSGDDPDDQPDSARPAVQRLRFLSPVDRDCVRIVAVNDVRVVDHKSDLLSAHVLRQKRRW